MLKGSPLHGRTAPLCQGHEWQRWHGFLAAAAYGLDHEWEYHALRGSAGLIDVSPLRKYRITGAGAEALLNRIVTRDVRRCRPGRVLYTPWCDEAGKVLDDGTVQRLGPETFRLTAAEPSLLWLQRHRRGLDVEVEDESETTAGLALQGPASTAILSAVCQPGVEDLHYFGLGERRLAGVPVTVSRTGFTGDRGYEIWIPADRAVEVWDALMDAGAGHGIVPAGMHALGVARVEAGLILIGVDYVPAHAARTAAQTSSPFELGLGWAVDLAKGSFTGRAALAAERGRRPEWRLAGFEVDWGAFEALHERAGLEPEPPRLAWRTSVPVYGRSGQVGYATSGCYSPVLKRIVGLATVRAPLAGAGTALEMEVTVEHRRERVPVRVVPTPFYDPPGKRQ